MPSDSSHSALVIPSNSVRSKHGFPNTLMSAKYRAGHEGRNRKAIDARPPEGLPTAPEVNAWWSEARQWIKQVVKGLLDRTEIEADDVTQSVITKALAALPQFRGDSQFKTWLYRITIRTVADYRNGIRSDTASLDDVNLGQDDTMGPYFEPVAETVDFVCYIHASELLSKLSPRDSSILEAKFEGETAEEIAARLQMKAAAVRQRISKSLRRLYKMHQQEEQNKLVSTDRKPSQRADALRTRRLGSQQK